METQWNARLAQMPYEEYLETAEWAEKRDLVLERDAYMCRVCSSRARLQIHHRTYARRGNEDLNDLTTLCERCHENAHEGMSQQALMAQTYEPPVIKRNPGQDWEDYLIGLLLRDAELLSHVSGIISEQDFQNEDTKVLYQILETSTRYNLPLASQLPKYLEPVAARCEEIVSSSFTTNPSRGYVRECIQTATRLKRNRLLVVNKELSSLISLAWANGDTVEVQRLQRQQLDVFQELRTANSAVHLRGCLI